MTVRIINLTPHSIVLRAPSGDETTIPSSGVARVTSTPGALETISGIPVPVAGTTTFGEVTGLPAPEEGAWFVVSAIVGAALRGSRADVLCPGTGPADGAIRNEQGQVIAVTRLVRA
jgi:hypothetical protein